MVDEIKIKKRKKAKHRLKARMRKRVYIILATSFFAIGIAAMINFKTNIYTVLGSVLIYAATGIGCGFILFLYIFRLMKGRKEFTRKV
jgi:polyferredoxin